jgi:hypothetical protein
MTEQVKREPTPMHLQVEKINIQTRPILASASLSLSFFFVCFSRIISLSEQMCCMNQHNMFLSQQIGHTNQQKICPTDLKALG